MKQRTTCGECLAKEDLVVYGTFEHDVLCRACIGKKMTEHYFMAGHQALDVSEVVAVAVVFGNYNQPCFAYAAFRGHECRTIERAAEGAKNHVSGHNAELTYGDRKPWAWKLFVEVPEPEGGGDGE